MSGDKSYFYDFIPVRYEISDSKREDILTTFPPPTLPENEEFFNIDNEPKGNNVSILVLLNDFEIHFTRTNKQFLRINFNNNIGTINAVIWDNQGEVDKYTPLLEKFSVF